MRILLVSYYFAPANALRASRLAAFLEQRGHDVRVLCAEDAGLPRTLDCELAADRVLRTAQRDINWLPRRLAALYRSEARTGGMSPDPRSGAAVRPKALPDRVLHLSATLYTNALNWPDARAGWLPYAWRAGRRLVRSWRPDLVYASSPPPTGLLVGKLLAARCGAPWIAEFRDRWSDDPYYSKPAWRQALETWLERRVVSAASAIVTVSEPWARRYAETYRKPTAVVLNGFEPQDYAGRPSCGAPESRGLEIVYTGGIYPGRRDPTPVFQALARSPADSTPVRVHFYGTDPASLRPLAAAEGVVDRIVLHPHVPHAEAAAIQQAADVLLLMQWHDPREQGNIPGKLFEYLGARRPILGLGFEGGEPARIIRERGAGCFANDPARIAAQLSAWLETKRRQGCLPPLPADVAAGFTRAEQFARLEQLLGEIFGHTQGGTVS